MSPLRWLRLSYWIGAIADAVAGLLMVFPSVGRRVYGISGFDPTSDYRYAMALAASLMFGWTALLLWADRKPVERKGVLMITVLVILGLAGAGVYAVSSGLIPFAHMVPTWIFQAALIALFTYSFFGSSTAELDVGEGGTSLSEAAAEFFTEKRFAVAGVSRSGNAPANLIYRKIKASGREVFPINPKTDLIEGEACYPSLASLPVRVSAVVIATHPDQAMNLARQCKEAGVRRVWFHRSIDRGSVTKEAVRFVKDYGASVIPGSCPVMHLEPVDFGHRCIRAVLHLSGKLPKTNRSWSLLTTRPRTVSLWP